jgi:hypothetical protein
MKSYSQAGQDLFVAALHPEPGIFCDIGAAGLSISNTLALEEAGWRGWCIDNSPEAMDASRARKVNWMCADATRLDYSFLPPFVDYLSIDVDQYSLDALYRIIDTSRTRFGIITCEHDAYERGEALRTPMTQYLRAICYPPVCDDVCHEGKSFEVWAVGFHLWEPAKRFMRDNPTDWKEILGL